MKEASFADMDLPRLLELQRIWEAQVLSADDAGHEDLVLSLCIKLEKLGRFIDQRRRENLNDLFA